MKFRIYTDTSVLGGCEDEEFAEHSIRFMDSFVRGDRILVLSSLTIQELAAAPINVRRRLASVPEGNIETLQLDGFDAVAMMRTARDRISAEIEGMTLEEELKWLASQDLHDPFLRRLRERAAQHASASDSASRRR